MDATPGLTTLDAQRHLATDTREDLRVLRDAAHRLDMTEVEARMTEVMRRMDEAVFRIAVVGEFKRGKSTLINALLGQEILPADVLPCSATLNRVTWGLTPAVRLVFRPDAEGVRREAEIPVASLADYVTRMTPESEARAADIEEAVVFHPLRFCRDKADIIDTPGLNDDEMMTRVTLGVLPQVDAAIFVILAQSPFSGFEAEFLNRLLTHELGRVLFVVNRMDEIRREPDRARVLDVVRTRIEKAIRTRAHELHGEDTPEARALLARIGTPKVFGVSGALALEARIAGDEAAVEKAGFSAFEDALERFLAMERGAVSLLIAADAGLAAAQAIQRQAALRRGAAGMEAAQFEAAWQRTGAELAHLRASLDAELARLGEAATALRATLRPRAGELVAQLRTEARRVIDTWPLDADAVARDALPATAERMSDAVRDRLMTVARRESERVQAEIEAALAHEVAALGGFGAKLEAALAEIGLRFGPETQDAGLGAGVVAGAGAVSSAVGGWLVGGALSGALTGYQVAGLRGAAAGAAAGAAVGFGTVAAGGVLIAALGLPLAWPVVLPTLAVAGLASSFGARWFTRQIFAGEHTQRFRARFADAVIGQLDASADARVRDVEAGIQQQVVAAFSALEAQVRRDLGGTIEATRRTLDDLRMQRARATVTGERDAAALDATLAEAHAIATRLQDRAAELRAVLPS